MTFGGPPTPGGSPPPPPPALPPPSVPGRSGPAGRGGPWPPGAPAEPPRGRGGRRHWLLVSGLVALVAAAVGVVIVTRGDGSRTTDLATISADEVVFDAVEFTEGVTVLRSWRIDDDVLHAAAAVRNETAEPRWVVYDEVVPEGFAGDVVADSLEGPDAAEELADGAHRFRREVPAGGHFAVTYDVALAESPSLDDLEAWTEQLDAGLRRHLADPAVSPRDGDVDGEPDGVDECVDEPGTLAGCPDGDGDGVRDGQDACADDPGTVSGCPDEDGDGYGEGLDDDCPAAAGTSAAAPTVTATASSTATTPARTPSASPSGHPPRAASPAAAGQSSSWPSP